MCNYVTLVRPLIECLQPKHFCEIGSDEGLHTRFLSAWCEENGARLTIVDPIAESYHDAAAQTFITHRREMSLDFLKEPNDVDVYYIDGDHNYETVSKELDLIRQNKRPNYAICLFIHDTSWPCARRDLYYQPETVKAPHRFLTKGFGISPYSAELVEDTSFAHHLDVAIATHEGGPRNGVLTAVSLPKAALSLSSKYSTASQPDKASSALPQHGRSVL